MFELELDTSVMQQVSRALAAEADGKALRRGLAKELRKAVEPAVAELKSAAQAIPSQGLPHAEGGPLSQAIARQIKPEARLSGRATGVRIKAKKRGMPRGFPNAPKRTNRRRGWRHRVFGRDVWVEQVGKPGWFDDTTRGTEGRYREACLKAMSDALQRIKDRIN